MRRSLPHPEGKMTYEGEMAIATELMNVSKQLNQIKFLMNAIWLETKKERRLNKDDRK